VRGQASDLSAPTSTPRPDIAHHFSLSLTPPQLTPLFADDGTYNDWDQLDSLWEHALM